MSVRVRFAPSPTGFLHIGGVRTALYNWLFARQHKGEFILRIEDTDEARSTKESVDVILQGLKWLGLNWDEGPQIEKQGITSKGLYGPYFQTQRLKVYQEHVNKLIEENKAYYCYCTPEELKEEREKAKNEGRPPKYNEKCRNLTEEQRIGNEKQEKRKVVRFKNNFKDKIVFKDIVKGEISFDPTLLDDFVILKPNGVPIYNFAVVIDDYLMKITHVIRGDDHISNTPRQIMLYKSFGWEEPFYAHIPMILGSDKARLSKRHGATSVTAYKDEGYLPDALVNYLALLGWSTTDSQQLFFEDELLRKFRLEKCSSSAAVFDPMKLLWINGEYIRHKSIDEFYDLCLEELRAAELIPKKIDKKEEIKLKEILLLEQEKVKTLKEVPELYGFMLKEDVEWDETSINKVLKKEGTREILENIIPRIEKIKNFKAENLEKLARQFSEDYNLKTSKLFHPLRVATSGKTKGPSLFQYMEILGKETVLHRIRLALELI